MTTIIENEDPFLNTDQYIHTLPQDQNPAAAKENSGRQT